MGDEIEKDEIHVFLPERASNKIDTDLVTLTQWLVENGVDDGSGGTKGLLGGQYGYGVNFENDVFMMHSYCWCERADCPWCLGCECDFDPESKDGAFKGEPCAGCKKQDEGVHPLPNFLYKPTGFEVTWYKWIGRSSVYSGKITVEQWDAIMKHCRESIKNG